MDTNNFERLNKSLLESAMNILKGEQLDEVSKETLQSYQSKAKADPAFAKKKGRVSKDVKQTRDKRLAGLETAAKKLYDIRAKEHKEHFAKSKAKNDDLHAHFHKEAPKILAKHGYSKVSDSESRSTYVRPHETGHVTTITLNKKNPDMGPSTHDFGSSINMSTRHDTHDAGYHVDSEEHAKAKREMMPKFEAAVINHHSDPWHWRHVNESFNLGVFSDDELENLDTLLSEDFEQLDELSKKTLGSYVKKASASLAHRQSEADKAEYDYIKDGSKENLRDLSNKSRKAGKRYSGIVKAADKLTKEDLENFSEEELEFLDLNLDEDSEQLDELSKKTLGSYIKKASGTFDHERNTPGRVATSAEDARRYITDPKNDPYYGSNGNKKIYNKIEKKLSNRRSGINKALDRLTKEETED